MFKGDQEIEKKEDEGIKSPFVAEATPPVFDYDKLQYDTTNKAMIEILKCLGKNAELLVFNHDVEQSVIVENLSKVGQEILNIMIDFKVPNRDVQHVSDTISHIPYNLFTIVSRQKIEFEKELMARYVGVRDPGNQKYSKEYATLGDTFAALIKLRNEQGNNVEDYYTLVKKENPQ